jgi:cobalt-zinc-cadmium efflux system outer membrane protein
VWVRIVPAVVVWAAVCFDSPAARGDDASRVSTLRTSVPPPLSAGPANTAGSASTMGTRLPAIAPPRPVPPLSLAELENLALQNNPTIRSAEALVVQEQALLKQLTRYPNPTVGWIQSSSAPRFQGATQGAFIGQDIVTAGKLKLVGQVEKMEIAWRQWQLKAQIGRVVNDVRMRYYEVLGAQHVTRAAAELERLAAEDLRAVAQLLDAKQASRPDLLQAEIHLNAVHSLSREATLRHQAAWRQLGNLVGVPFFAPAVLPDGVEGPVPQFEWNESLRRLMAESPVLCAQAAQVREAEIELQLQKRLVVPNLNVQTVIQRDYVKDFDNVSTLVSAPIPLWNRNRGNIINAEATLRQQQQEYKRLQLALADQLAASFQQLLSAQNQVEHLREILPRTEENVRLTTQAFKEGHAGFDFMRVRDAEQTYYHTKTSYIDALTSLHKFAIEISGLELTGGLNPPEIGTALQPTPGVPAGLGGVLLQYSHEQSAGIGQSLPGALQSTLSGPQ